MSIRDDLVRAALVWENAFGIAPHITSAISEYDAAMLVGLDDNSYKNSLIGRTAVSNGYDFMFNGIRYQIKANRPSGKPGSRVTKVGKASNYKWDILIWILYNVEFVIAEAWQWDCDDYISAFDSVDHVRPEHMRQGKRLV